MIFELKYKTFHSWNCFSNCRLRNGSHFVRGRFGSYVRCSVLWPPDRPDLYGLMYRSEISPISVPNDPVVSKPTLVQVMAWCTKPLPKPMLAKFCYVIWHLSAVDVMIDINKTCRWVFGMDVNNRACTHQIFLGELKQKINNSTKDHDSDKRMDKRFYLYMCVITWWRLNQKSF